MALYDPATGKWVEYKPSSFVQDLGTEEGGTPATPEYQASELAPATGTFQNVGKLIDPAGGDAHGLAAQLLRAQFADWQSFFQPIELQAMRQLSFNNPDVLTGAVGKAKESAEGAFEGMAGILGRENRAMGVTPDVQQEATSRRLIDLNKALAIAGGANQARANVRTQDESILLGTSPNPNIVRASQ